MTHPRPVALIILDGWGIAPACDSNAVTCATTPFLDSLFAAWPHGRLLCYGEAVGLPEGQMGNSEVGHLNLGAGRVVYQDITRINQAIRQGQLAANPALGRAFDRVRASGGTLHLLGLLSDGGVHSLQVHLYALIAQARAAGVERIAVHAFLDGRATPPDSGAGLCERGGEHRIGRELARGDRVVDAREVLVDHAPGADVEVADLGVAHLALGQAHRHLGGIDGGVRARCQQLAVVRHAGVGDGIVGGRLRATEAVEDQEDDRTHGGTHRRGRRLGGGNRRGHRFGDFRDAALSNAAVGMTRRARARRRSPA